MSRMKLAVASAVLMLAPGVAQAHHSFAAFFEGSQTVKLTGKVTAFRSPIRTASSLST